MIRELTDSDVAACFEIVGLNWGAAIAKAFLGEVRHAFMPHLLYHPTYYVYIHKNKIVGFAGVMPSLRMMHIWDLVWVNVDPFHQANGVGRKLIKRCIKEVKRKDGAVIHLMTREVNFFKKQGFSDLHHYHWGKGDWHLMGLQLRELTFE